MKMRYMLMIGASAVVFTSQGANAEEPSAKATVAPGAAVIEVPQGRTIVEATPGTTVEVAPSATIEATPGVSTQTTTVQTTTSTSGTLVDEPAGAPAWRDRFHYDRDADAELYPDQEFTIDLFGAYGKDKRKFNDTIDKTMRHGDWGAGVGVNYFFTKNIGIGADAFGLDNGSDFVDAVNGSIIFRLPIDVAHLAPYAFGGGGRQFQGSDTWTLHVGAGLEVRLNSHTGIFIDGRHVFSDKGSDFALIRSGLRLAF